MCWSGRGRTRSRSRSPRTSRVLPGKRSGCRRGRGSPPAASCRGSPAPGGGGRRGSTPFGRFAGRRTAVNEAAVFVQDDDRLEAIVVVMGVEQSQLLAAVDSIEGVVNVEGDPPRHLAKRPAIEIDQSTAEAQ